MRKTVILPSRNLLWLKRSGICIKNYCMRQNVLTMEIVGWTALFKRSEERRVTSGCGEAERTSQGRLVLFQQILGYWVKTLKGLEEQGVAAGIACVIREQHKRCAQVQIWGVRGEQVSQSLGLYYVRGTVLGMSGSISHTQHPTEGFWALTLRKAYDSFGQSAWYMSAVFVIIPFGRKLGQWTRVKLQKV